MSSGITYNNSMYFSIDGTRIPDPSRYDYSSQSLDTSAERDTKGLLHRKMVATKYNVSLEWQALDYETASNILRMVKSPKIEFGFPCPEVPITTNSGRHIGNYYAGDRKVSVVKAVGTDKTKWVASLQFDLIEY